MFLLNTFLCQNIIKLFHCQNNLHEIIIKHSFNFLYSSLYITVYIKWCWNSDEYEKRNFCDYHMKNDKMLMYFDKGNRTSTVYFTSKHSAYLWLAFLLQPGYHKRTNKCSFRKSLPTPSLCCHNFLTLLQLSALSSMSMSRMNSLGRGRGGCCWLLISSPL